MMATTKRKLERIANERIKKRINDLDTKIATIIQAGFSQMREEMSHEEHSRWITNLYIMENRDNYDSVRIAASHAITQRLGIPDFQTILDLDEVCVLLRPFLFD